MAHFSPVNGAFPHKDQIDRSCLVAAGNAGIQRGTILVVNTNGEFEIAKDASVGPLYFALQDYGDLQAAMAGEVGFGKGRKVPSYGPGNHVGEADHVAAKSRQPKITGLSFQEHGNYQTDMYDKTITDYQIGDKLTVVKGVFTKIPEGDTVSVPVATVFEKPKRYYANDATLVPGWSTGTWIYVLRVSL